MSNYPYHGPEHWRQRAEELRVIAESTKDAGARATLLRIVVDYERLAKWAERPTYE